MRAAVFTKVAPPTPIPPIRQIIIRKGTYTVMCEVNLAINTSWQEVITQGRVLTYM